MTLLNKGFQRDLYYKPKNWITTLALEAKKAVSYLPIYETEFMKCQWQRSYEIYKETINLRKINTKQNNQIGKERNKTNKNKS